MKASRCDICGKGPQFGHLVSHAHNLSNHKQYPNVHRTRVNIQGASRTMRVCTRCLRSGRISKVAGKAGLELKQPLLFPR
ncbi:MAG: 50S ribosomal protein L28 [bacterium]